MGSNGFFAGETDAGDWDVFEVGRKVGTFATEAEAVAETDRLTAREVDRLDKLADAHLAAVDDDDDSGAHVGVANATWDRAWEIRARANALRRTLKEKNDDNE